MCTPDTHSHKIRKSNVVVNLVLLLIVHTSQSFLLLFPWRSGCQKIFNETSSESSLFVKAATFDLPPNTLLGWDSEVWKFWLLDQMPEQPILEAGSCNELA